MRGGAEDEAFCLWLHHQLPLTSGKLLNLIASISLAATWG